MILDSIQDTIHLSSALPVSSWLTVSQISLAFDDIESFEMYLYFVEYPSIEICQMFFIIRSVCVCVCVCEVASVVSVCATLWAAACKAPLSMGFSRQEHWSGLSFPSPGDLPDTWIEPGYLALQANFSPSEPLWKPIIRPSSSYTWFLCSFDISTCLCRWLCVCAHFWAFIDTTRCSKFILCIFCPHSRINRSSKTSGSFYWRMILQSKSWLLHMFLFLECCCF